MEMKLNINALIQEREKRAWTQSHLAELCNLSLRTIQRIEKSGVSSKESASALASVYELELEKLVKKTPLDKSNQIQSIRIRIVM